MVTTEEKIAKIWRENFLDWKSISLYEFVASFEDETYELKIQGDLDVVAALAELKKYRDVEEVAAQFPQVTQRELSDVANEGIRRFQSKPVPARNGWHPLLLFLYAVALAVPIVIAVLKHDEVYFISKNSTAVVTSYMLLPYFRGGYLSLGMYWKFAETRLIHPLAPLFFVIVTFAPSVSALSEELWYKALSGFLAMMLLFGFIYLTSFRNKNLLAKIAKDAAKRPSRATIEEEADFHRQRVASKTCFERALAAMLKFEKGDDRVKIGHAKRDQASFRKQTFSFMIAALGKHAPPATGEKPNLWGRFKTWLGTIFAATRLLINITDPHWDIFHHPLPKSPVLFIEVGFIIGQLVIYRGYVVTFIDTVATQTRVLLKLGNIVFDQNEPAEASLAEFARLVAGAILGFLELGIPFAFLGRSWVQGINQLYLSLGLTATKMLCSNHVAPTINILSLLIVLIFEKLYKLTKECF